MSGSGAEENVLLHAVTALRTEVAGSSLPLEIPQTQSAKAHREALLHQLDDYVLPRLSSLDAPLLAVIGGSTGAGKSTLVNSIVDSEVSRSGILQVDLGEPEEVHSHEARSGVGARPRLHLGPGSREPIGDDPQQIARVTTDRHEIVRERAAPPAPVRAGEGEQVRHHAPRLQAEAPDGVHCR